MTETIDFYFDVGSPASYLAWTQPSSQGMRCFSGRIGYRNWSST